jgi:aminopyrrolnitrin oxygenase
MPAKSLNSSCQAPAADAFPADPASWYLFCESRQLRKGPFSQRILGRLLVAFRTAGGNVVVMDGNCAHLGADLGCGSVVGETIQCPFHHWRYGADGVCASVPGLPQVPSFARLRTYPVEERHGYVFFFHGANGAEPLFPLPFFFGEDPRGYVAGKVFRYVADCTWWMNSAHAFDRQHFSAVHDRELLGPPIIDCPAPFARRNRYDAKVVGHTVFDRILRRTAGRTVKISLTIWGGTFAVISSEFARLPSGFLMAMEPLDNGQTLCHGIVYARRTSALLRGLDPFRLWLRTLFTHGYLKEEARQLRATRYNPGSLGPSDQDMIDFFHWVAQLSKGDYEVDDENRDRGSDAGHGRPARLVASAAGTRAGGDG